MTLSGRVALVTGASQGIGRACALKLAQSGATLALAARSQEKLSELVAEIDSRWWQGSGLPTRRRRRRADQIHVQGRNRAVRQDRYPGEQCRHYPRPAGHAHEARRLGRRPQYQPDVGISLYSAGDQFDAQAALGTDHQYHLDLWSDRAGGTGQLCSLEGRADRADHGHCARSRLAQHHLQRRRSRIHRNRDDLRAGLMISSRTR